MEAIESTYSAPSLDERAYFFFPNSSSPLTQRNSKRLRRARREVASSITARSSMMSMSSERSRNSMSLCSRTRLSTTRSISTSSACSSSCSHTATSQRKLLSPSKVIFSSKNCTCLQTYQSLKPSSYHFVDAEQGILLSLRSGQEL